ncbi:LysE family translocator [Corynebacterium tapiri]|uniref:LysE family translocator n=1 Tax=Corynebacterium tapiri TaxID=1448266 RepID=A0A5C4U2G9_9CORY|nr:LysE family translocator [Corynebacterium tapiri]TNL96781.1 LysE family translocator [Corynebacterium tapiri]
MSVASLGALIVTWLAALASPGPDLVQIVRVGSRSQRAGLACAVGIMTGNFGWAVLSLAGLAALMKTYPPLLGALQLCGGAYLMWLGWASIRASGAAPETRSEAISVSPGKAWRIGLSTNLANPKAILFFGAIFAQFVQPGMGWQWSAVVLVILVSIGLAWFCGVAMAVGSMASFLARHARVIDTVTGLLFLALGVWMLVSGARVLLG